MLFPLIFQTFSYAQQMDARFDIAHFQSENTPYIETYLSVNGNGVSYLSKANGTFQATISVVIEFLQGGNVIRVDKYNLSSPEIKDTSIVDFVFLDKQRYQLSEGNYTIRLKIADKNKTEEDIKHEQPITIKSIINGFSDIQLVESYSQTTNKNILSKGGYDLVPFISNLYNTSNKKLSCYFEYYSETDEEILIQSSIVSQSTQKIVNELIKRKKCKSLFDASLITFSIEDFNKWYICFKN